MDIMSRSQICFSFTSVDLELESIKWIRSSHDSQHGNLKRLCAAYSSISSDGRCHFLILCRSFIFNARDIIQTSDRR